MTRMITATPAGRPLSTVDDISALTVLLECNRAANLNGRGGDPDLLPHPSPPQKKTPRIYTNHVTRPGWSRGGKCPPVPPPWLRHIENILWNAFLIWIHYCTCH